MRAAKIDKNCKSLSNFSGVTLRARTSIYIYIYIIRQFIYRIVPNNVSDYINFLVKVDQFL